MGDQNEKDWFQDIETIVSEPLKFKAKLAIGEDAYTSLRIKNTVAEAWDVAGVAATAAGIAQVPFIAGFFAPTGLFAVIGIGSAFTPLPWVIAAGVVTGGAWFGLTRYFKSKFASRVTVIPDFINTPLDVLALGLFDLLTPLALKVADVDGHIDESERMLIDIYFVKEWGYDPAFVAEGVKFVESKLSEYSIKNSAESLAEVAKENPDCNFKSMSEEILGFLRNITEVDGRIDEREEMAIERIESIFKNAGSFLSGIRGS